MPLWSRTWCPDAVFLNNFCYNMYSGTIITGIGHYATRKFMIINTKACNWTILRISSIHFKFIHLAVCLRAGPKPLTKRALHIVRSRASSFKWEYPLLSLRSSSSFLRLLPRLPVTSIPPFIFPSITRYRRQFLRKMWPIHTKLPTWCTEYYLFVKYYYSPLHVSSIKYSSSGGHSCT